MVRPHSPKIWVITDTHLGHNALIELCGRPPNFSDKILNNIQALVMPGDTLIHLGDVCLGNDEFWNAKLIESCLGKKCLIRGNHDKKSLTWYSRIGWDFVADSVLIKYFGKRILFTHRPFEFASDFYDVNIFGHLHNLGHKPDKGDATKQKLLILEKVYAPVTLKSVLSLKRKNYGNQCHNS